MGGDAFKTKRLLSLSQPELDTSDVFDIPSPPPVAANRFELGFSALKQPRPSGTQEPLEAFDHAGVADHAPTAPAATVPELQTATAASSEETLPAHEKAAQHALTPAAMEEQATPIHPAERPQVDLDPLGHKGAVLEPAARTIDLQNDVLQRSAATEASCDASVRGEISHDLPEAPDTGGSQVGGPHTAGVASTPAAPPPAVSQKKSPRLANPDAVYGALSDSLFPQSFSSELLSSFSTLQSKTVVRTVDAYRTETGTPAYLGQSLRPAAGGDGPGDPVSVSGGSRLTSYRTEAEAFRGSGVHSRAPPPSLHSRFESTDGGKQAEASSWLSGRPLLHSSRQEDTPRMAAPPVCGYGTAPGRDARVTDSVPPLTRVRRVVRDELSSRALSPSPAPEHKSVRNPEWKSRAPAPPGDMEGLLSPMYLSVGSDDGSAMDIYYSAEEDNAESDDEEMYTMDEGGAQMGNGVTTVGELVRPGDFSAGGEGKFRGMVVQKSGGEEKEEGQARGHSSEAQLQEDEPVLEVTARVEEEQPERRSEKLPTKPVLQGQKVEECDFVPPSAENCGQQIWAREWETEEPPVGAQRSGSLPPAYLAQSSESGDARPEVITAKGPPAEQPASTVAQAEKSGEDGRRPPSAAADTSAPLTAQHNRVPQGSEWVDTITRSAGGGRNPESEEQLHLTDTHPAAAAPLSAGPELPAGARPDPSRR